MKPKDYKHITRAVSSCTVVLEGLISKPAIVKYLCKELTVLDKQFDAEKFRKDCE